MMTHRMTQMICRYIMIIPLCLSMLVRAHSAEFEIDEIITALKQEIQTANLIESGNPKFTIETVDVVLSVVSTYLDKGGVSLRIAGFSEETQNNGEALQSYHQLAFSFKPAEASGSFTEASLGLVEPIKKIKQSLRKAYNSPPSLNMDGLSFKLEFAIKKSSNGVIGFKTMELEDIKAQNIPTHRITLYMVIKE